MGAGGTWLRKAVRAASPTSVRVGVAVARRAWADRAAPAFAERRETCTAFTHLVTRVEQDIRQSAFAKGKRANILIGAERLNGAIVRPGELFSFWRLVGPPSPAAGFQEGRSIRNGSATGDVGGGLCQVSGIVYEAFLRAGMLPIERHPHSRDLYTEEERFTPLGLDATIVWPYKDLRLANDRAVPVQLMLTVRAWTLTATIRASASLPSADINIVRSDESGSRHVRLFRRLPGGESQLVSDDLYGTAAEA